MRIKLKLKNKEKAFTLIEVLIAVALIAVVATAYLELMISIDKRSTTLEIEDTAQSIAIETVNNIRKIRLEANGWNNIVDVIQGENERAYKYDFENNSFIVYQGKQMNVNNSGISTYAEFKSFCTDPANDGYCGYSNGTQFRRDLAYDDVFSIIVSASELDRDNHNGPRVINIYVGCNPSQNCDTFIKLSTVVTHY